jgi:hypothetical protein
MKTRFEVIPNINSEKTRKQKQKHNMWEIKIQENFIIRNK